MPKRYEDSEQRVRITVSVDPEVWSDYMEAALSLGMSASRFIGDWLGDTRESMHFVVGKMHEARLGPSRVLPRLEEVMEDAEREREKLLATAERRRKVG